MTGSQGQIRSMAEQMKKNSPEAKLLVIVCDPAIRLFSHLRHMTNNAMNVRMSRLTPTLAG